MYNNLFEIFIKENLISSNQSGFKRRVSYIYQITHIIFMNHLINILTLAVFFLIPSKLSIKLDTNFLLLK